MKDEKDTKKKKINKWVKIAFFTCLGAVAIGGAYYGIGYLVKENDKIIPEKKPHGRHYRRPNK